MVSYFNTNFIKHGLGVHHEVQLKSLTIQDDWLYKALSAVVTVDFSDI